MLLSVATYSHTFFLLLGCHGRKTCVENENKEEGKEALALSMPPEAHTTTPSETDRELKEELKAELKATREMLATLTEQYARSHEQVGALTQELEHVCAESLMTEENYGQRLAHLHTQIATLEER